MLVTGFSPLVDPQQKNWKDAVLRSTIIDQVRQYHTADIFDDDKPPMNK